MEARRERDAWAVEVRSGGVPETGGKEKVEEVALAWLRYIEGLVEIGELRPRTLWIALLPFGEAVELADGRLTVEREIESGEALRRIPPPAVDSGAYA
jgi:hypothetical protein